MVRRRAIYYPPRSEGGPYFIIKTARNHFDNWSVTFYFTDVPLNKQRGQFKHAKLLEVSKQRIKVYPRIIREDVSDYLESVYAPITYFIFDNPLGTLPRDEDEAEELLKELPTGFGKSLKFGLTIPNEYRFILQGIHELSSNINSIRFLDSFDSANEIKGTQYRMSLETFDKMRKKIDRITERHNERSLNEKESFVSQVLRDGLDPSNYRYHPPAVRRDEIATLTQDGKVASTQLTKRDKKAVVSVVKGSMDELVKDQPSEMMRLSADIELVSLRKLIERFEEMMGKTLTESKWQAFFKDNPFVLSLAFSTPTIFLQDNVFVGGTRMTRDGGKLVDFLYKTASTGNLAIIEIKRPDNELLGITAYRDDLHAPHQKLSGAVIQVMDQRSKLHRKFDGLIVDSGYADIQASAIQCAVIVGRTPGTNVERHSFDLYRHSLTNVTVLTFDELLGKLKAIESVLGEGKRSEELDEFGVPVSASTTSSEEEE